MAAGVTLLEPPRCEGRLEQVAADREPVVLVGLEVGAVRLEPPAHQVGEGPALGVLRQRLEPVSLALGPPLELDEERLRLGLRLRLGALLHPGVAAVLELQEPDAIALEDGAHRFLPFTAGARAAPGLGAGAGYRSVVVRRARRFEPCSSAQARRSAGTKRNAQPWIRLHGRSPRSTRL